MKPQSPPGVVSCMALLALVDVALRILGFGRTLRMARILALPGQPGSEPALMHATLDRIITATAFYPGRSRCLEQSIVGYIMMRRRGFDARLRLGVQPYPFNAHAWIELDGMPVTESPEVIAGFALMPDLVV